jgi:TRAP transporter TAXI family solute receptor
VSRIVAILTLIYFALQLASAQERFHFFASLGTGPLNGVYYPVGGAICEIVNENLRSTSVRCSREMTPGSVYNVDALHSGELEFGIVQSDVAFAAYTGKGVLADRAAPELRSVLILHPELVTIVARSGIHKLADLAGKRINVGPEGSGARLTWDAIGEAIGWYDAESPRVVDMPADAIGSALCSGAIDAALLVVGHPSRRISALLARCDLNLVTIEGPAVDSLVASAPYWRKGRIRGELYGQVGDTPSFGVSAVLMTTAHMDERVVAALAQALVKQIEALKTEDPVLADVTVEGMISGNLPAPLHPAAAQFYKSIGLLN